MDFTSWQMINLHERRIPPLTNDQDATAATGAATATDGGDADADETTQIAGEVPDADKISREREEGEEMKMQTTRSIRCDNTITDEAT